MKASHWVWLPVAAISTSAYATTYFSVEQAQRAIFPGASLTSTGRPNTWRTSNGGYFIVERVVGKHEYITVAIGVNPNGTVKQIEIMDYKESYGYEVREAQWRAQFVGKTASSPLQIQFNTDNNKSALTLHATLERYLDGAPPTSQIKGELSNFLITLFGVIGLRVSSITFNSTNGSKTDVAAHLPASNPIAFLGALQFVQAIADVLPPGLFGGAGPSITLAPSYVKVSYTLGLPSLSVGVLSLEHIALTTGLDLPYLDGKPAFEFAFASRSSPFLITVECLGGGGFVHLIVNADGVQMVEGALEFGGEFSIDLGVASGGVHIMAGIYFQLTNTATTLTGFVDIGGEVSVLGIISISIDLNLSLSFIHTSQGDKVQGRATLTISVHVFFFGISASVSVEKSFGSGKGDPRVRQLIGPTDWAAYAAAFA